VSGFRALQRAVASALRASVVRDPGPPARADALDWEHSVWERPRWEDTVVLVPSEGAADQLKRTLQSLWARDAPDATELPAMVTRGGLYAYLAQRLTEAPPMLDELAREVLFRRAADAAVAQGSAPPFEVRPGLIPEMLALYDALRRQHRTID